MFVFFMTATTTLSSFTSLQVRGGGDGGESYSFNVPYYGGKVDTGLPNTWGYNVELQNNPSWVSYNSEDAAPDNHMCFRIEFNTTTVARETRFTATSYTNTGRAEYEIHILQDPWPGI